MKIIGGRTRTRTGTGNRTVIRIGTLVLVLLLLSGCMSKFPAEVVELNVTMGKDIQALHRSYRALINTHFDTLRMQVDVFIKNRWMPTFIKDFKQRGNLDNLVKSGRSDRVNEWTKVAMETGVKKQKQLIAPVDAQEKKLLKMVDQSFQMLGRANEAITNHLKSHAKSASLDTAMNILDLKGLRQQIDSGLAEASDLTRRQTSAAPPKQGADSTTAKKTKSNEGE